MFAWDFPPLAGCLVSAEEVGWEDCVPLQAADFMAYQGFQRVDSSLKGKDQVRKSLHALLRTRNPISVAHFQDENFADLMRMIQNARDGKPARRRDQLRIGSAGWRRTSGAWCRSSPAVTALPACALALGLAQRVSLLGDEGVVGPPSDNSSLPSDSGWMVRPRTKAAKATRDHPTGLKIGVTKYRPRLFG